MATTTRGGLVTDLRRLTAKVNALEGDVTEIITAPAPSPPPVSVPSIEFNILDFGASVGSADNSTAIQGAIDAANAAGGGAVIVPDAPFSYATKLNFDDKRRIIVRGFGTDPDGTGSALKYTSSTGNAVSLNSAYGIRFDDLAIGYSHASFTNDLVTSDHSGGGGDPSYLTFNRCYLGGMGGTTARSALRLNKTIVTTIRECIFRFADIGLIAGDGVYGNYATTILIEANTFLGLNTLSMRIGHSESVTLLGNIIENLVNGKAGTIEVSGVVGIANLAMIDQWMGDGTANGNPWVDILASADISGFKFLNNRMYHHNATPTDTCLRIRGNIVASLIAANMMRGAIGISFPTAATVDGICGANVFPGTNTPYDNRAGFTGNLFDSEDPWTVWTAPSYSNGWATFDITNYPPGYSRDGEGNVYLRGLVYNGTVGATMFTLPAGFRPIKEEFFPVVSNSAFGELRISSAGAVKLNTGSNAWVALDGVVFRAGA